MTSALPHQEDVLTHAGVYVFIYHWNCTQDSANRFTVNNQLQQTRAWCRKSPILQAFPSVLTAWDWENKTHWWNCFLFPHSWFSPSLTVHTNTVILLNDFLVMLILLCDRFFYPPMSTKHQSEGTHLLQCPCSVIRKHNGALLWWKSIIASFCCSFLLL